MKTGVILTAFVFLIACIVAVVLWIHDAPQSYPGILRHDKEYYAQIAESCSNLLSQTNYISKEYTINGDDASLPKPLLDLHATTVKVTDHVKMDIVGEGTKDVSGVSIVFGSGPRPDYVIGWGQDDYGNGHRPWELRIGGDDVGTIVFSTESTTNNNPSLLH